MKVARRFLDSIGCIEAPLHARAKGDSFTEIIGADFLQNTMELDEREFHDSRVRVKSSD